VAAVNLLVAKARDEFWEFRKLIHPKMLQGWFQYEVGRHLEQFYIDLVAGKRPKLLLSTPPQFGKSMMMADFIAWVAGKNPDLRTMFASYSDALGERANSDLQRIYDGEAYQHGFYDTKIPDRSNVSPAPTLGQTAFQNHETLPEKAPAGSQCADTPRNICGMSARAKWRKCSRVLLQGCTGVHNGRRGRCGTQRRNFHA
jgi:hypothetical protein